MPDRPSKTIWTKERDEVLRKGAAEGLSMGKVAKKLGVTRGMVAGRADRLNVRFWAHLKAHVS